MAGFGALDIGGDTLCNAVTGDDGIAQRDSLPVVSGKEDAGCFCFYLGHEVFEAAVADFVLWDRFWVVDVVLEGGFAPEAEYFLEVFRDDLGEFILGFGGEFRGACASDVAGESDVVFWGAIGEEGGGENGSEDAEAFHFGDEHAEAIQRVLDVLAAEAEDDGSDGGVFNIGERGCVGRVGGIDFEFGEAVGGDTEEDGLV